MSTTAYRYSLVWYAGRGYGLLSSCFVLLVLLSESTLLYARLAVSVAARTREREGRMMTMDALSASMAHDMNQPLGAIVANGESGLVLLEKSSPNLTELREVLADIVDDGHRAGEIIASIRSIFTTAPPARARIDIDEVIRDAMAILRAELNAHGVALDLQLGASTAAIVAHRGQVQQVILNLATNAIDAMVLGASRERALTIVSRLAEAGGAQVTVSDTGPGVDPGIAEQIFDPFFITREQGTGMGLAICRSLTASHGGRLWLAADRRHGAAFNLFLPAGDAARRP